MSMDINRNGGIVIPANACLQQAFAGIHNKPLDSGFRRNDDGGNGHIPAILPEAKQITMNLPPIFQVSPHEPQTGLNMAEFLLYNSNFRKRNFSGLLETARQSHIKIKENYLA